MELNLLKENDKNPRFIKTDTFKKLVQSIKDFPEMREAREIVVNKDMVILGGNMRYRAMQEAKVKEAPVKIVDWSEEKQREFIIKDNIESGDWDYDTLANEWDKIKLEEWGMDLDFITEDDEKYTQKIGEIAYEPSNKKPDILDLVDTKKANKLMSEINQLNIPQDEKNFLIIASTRHYIFDYSKIADYYANSNPKIKELMEKSALVIIDFDKAIQNGFVEMSEELSKLVKQQHGT